MRRIVTNVDVTRLAYCYSYMGLIIFIINIHVVIYIVLPSSRISRSFSKNGFKTSPG
jgi:hypothetical protein